MHKKVDRVESVHKALVLLKIVAEEGSLSVTEASKILEVNPSTASRLLQTLADDGFVQQGDRRHYYPGDYAPGFAGSMNSIPIKTRLRPYLEELFSLTNETVHLALLLGLTVRHHDCIEATNHALVFTNRLNKQVAAQSSSEGKCMLADLEPSVLQSRFIPDDGSSIDKITELNVARLQSELDKVRQRGYATNFEETEKGIAAFSVSLGHIDGEHLAMSVALPLARYSPEVGNRIQMALKTIKQKVASDF